MMSFGAYKVSLSSLFNEDTDLINMPTKYKNSLNCIRVMKQTLSSLSCSFKGDYLNRKQGKVTKFALINPINNLENRSFRNRESLQNKKTADSVLLSLFIRSNGTCSNSHVP